MMKNVFKQLAMILMLIIFIITVGLQTGILLPAPIFSSWLTTLSKECGRNVLILTVVSFVGWYMLFANLLTTFKNKISEILKIWDELQPHPTRPGKKQWSKHAVRDWEELAMVISYYHRRLQHHIASSLKIGVALTSLGLILVFPVVGDLLQQMGSVSPGELLGLLFDSGLATALVSTLLGITANISMGHIKISATGYSWDRFMQLDEEKRWS